MVEEARRIELSAEPESVARIRAEVAAYGNEHGMAPGRLLDLKTVVSEACGNVVRYAYEQNADSKPLEVTMTATGGELEVSVRDEGGGIRPNVNAQAPGLGLGLPLIGALSSRFRLCSRLGGGTELIVSVPIASQ